jgi:hypothetical protein
MGGLFAPAYIKGFAPSEAAVAAWQAQNRPMTSAMVDQTRMPDLYRPPSGNILMDGRYGSGVPAVQSYAGNNGMVDVNALRAASMGGAYDMQARRDAIAARIAENERLKNPAAPPPAPEPERMFRGMSDQELERRIKMLEDWKISGENPGP